MSMVKTAMTSSEYLALWRGAEALIAEEYSKFAGVRDVENQDDKLTFDNRIKELRKQSRVFQSQYENAYRIENNSSTSGRMKTFNNGL